MSCTWQFSLFKASRDTLQEWKFTNFIFLLCGKIAIESFSKTHFVRIIQIAHSLCAVRILMKKILKLFSKPQKFSARLSSILVIVYETLFCLYPTAASLCYQKNVSTSQICGRRAKHKKTGSIVELNYSIYGEQFVEFFLSVFAAASSHSRHVHSVSVTKKNIK